MTTQDIINDMRSNTITSMRAAADRLEELQRELTESIRERNKTVADLVKQRDEVMAYNRFTQQITATLPEPSRLEIAAMAMQAFISTSGFIINIPKVSLEYADALIAAAKETE